MDLGTLQSKLSYQFKDESLLVQSLTHPSYMVQAEEQESSNQRLEFLGDAVLELIISEYLFQEFPEIREGPLTQFRSALVKGSVLVDLADKLDLSDHIRTNRSDSKSSPKELPSAREDALEALIGAIYLDSDFKTTKAVVIPWYEDLKERLRKLNEGHNPKGRLQEKLQRRLGNDQIRYKTISESGPSHNRRFEVELFVGEQSCSKGTGKSKKEAEEEAARSVLQSFDTFDFTDA